MVSTAALPLDDLRARAAIADFEAATLLARMQMEGLKAANRQHKLEKGTALPFQREAFAAVEAELIAAQARFRAEIGLERA